MHQNAAKSKVVRLLQEKEGKPPVTVRVSVGTMGLPHLFNIFSRRHVDTNGMSLVDAQTMEEVTEAYLQQRLETALKPIDLCLCPTNELVEVNASVVSEDENDPDVFVTLHVSQSALTQDVCLASARAFKSEPLRLLRWDFSVVSNDTPFLDIEKIDREIPVDIVLARTSDLIPVTVSTTLTDKNQDGEGKTTSSTKTIEMLFYKHVTVAAVFRIALLALYKNYEIFSQELEFLDPLQHPIDEPASLTLQQCITRCGFVELPAGMSSYQLSVNDGLPVDITYSNGEISSRCTVVLPPSGLCVGDLLSKALSSMNLPGEESDYFLANSSGFALLDNAAEVNRHNIEKGLVVSSMDHLMCVYLNDFYTMGFINEPHPTVSTLLSGVGFQPTTRVRYNEVIVQNNLPLTVNGNYYFVEDSEYGSFVLQNILLPTKEHIQLRVSPDCTAAQLVEVLALLHPPPPPSEDSEEELIPALQDNTDCILADNLFACDFSNSTLKYCFV